MKPFVKKMTIGSLKNLLPGDIVAPWLSPARAAAVASENDNELCDTFSVTVVGATLSIREHDSNANTFVRVVTLVCIDSFDRGFNEETIKCMDFKERAILGGVTSTIYDHMVVWRSEEA